MNDGGSDNALTSILQAGSKGYWSIRGLNCTIYLEPRPTYCDRGNWIAKIDALPIVNIDGADGWPRYYFDFDRAQSEIVAWMEKRGESLTIRNDWEHHL